MIPPATLANYARVAEEHCDGRTLAFVAGQTYPGSDALRLADQAVAIDPQFTWIYSQIFRGLLGKDAQTQATRDRLIQRLETWDPDNSFPYLLEAQEVLAKMARNGASYPMIYPLDRLASFPAWRQAMAKAFAAPRFDSYAARWFELNRAWLTAHGLAQPGLFLTVLGFRPLVNLGSGGVSSYADLLTKELGKKAEAAGHVDEALGYYWAVAHMGEQLHLQGVGMTEQQAGESLQIEAYRHLLPLLQSMGRTQEASTIQYALAQFSRENDTYSGKNPFARSSNYHWAATMMDSTGTLVLILGLFTVLSLVYVNAKRWVRPEKKGPFYRIVAGAESWLAAWLFLACVGLYLSYYPYAQNFRHYMTTGGEIHDLEPLWYNILPTYSGVSDYNALSIGNPFRPYVWYALAGVALVALAAMVLRRRRPRDHQREEVSANARLAA